MSTFVCKLNRRSVIRLSQNPHNTTTKCLGKELKNKMQWKWFVTAALRDSGCIDSIILFPWEKKIHNNFVIYKYLNHFIAMKQANHGSRASCGVLHFLFMKCKFALFCKAVIVLISRFVMHPSYSSMTESMNLLFNDFFAFSQPKVKIATKSQPKLQWIFGFLPTGNFFRVNCVELAILVTLVICLYFVGWRQALYGRSTEPANAHSHE